MARLEALADLDFGMTPHDAHWNSNFEDLIKFRNEHGHLDVPSKGKLYYFRKKQPELRNAQKAGKTQFVQWDARRLSSQGAH